MTHRLETQLIHAGEPNPRIGGSATMPIFQSTVFEYADGADYHDIRYPRLSNLPNHEVLRRKIAALERAEDALVTSSGMAAISTSLLTIADDGGHVLVQDGVYGGTHGLLEHDLPALGISHDTFDSSDPSSWESMVGPKTRAIYVEAITNPLLQVIDHRAVVEFARAHGITSIIDSTFATPVNFKPLDLGYDLCVHSATKYLNGHSDVVAGAIAGRGDLVKRIKLRLDHLGGSLDPHACYLLYRGLRTLAVRVGYQNESAGRIAQFLEQREEIERVIYPGLESHPQHTRARELFDGCGGMLSFVPVGGDEVTEALLSALSLPVRGPSLGGVESLVSVPARVSHAQLSVEDLARIGLPTSLIRMSVGLEATEDLIEDLTAALAAAAGAIEAAR